MATYITWSSTPLVLFLMPVLIWRVPKAATLQRGCGMCVKHSTKRSLALQTQQEKTFVRVTRRACCCPCKLQLPSANMVLLLEGLPVACVVRVAQNTVQVVFIEWHGLIFIYEPDFTHLELSILTGGALCE